ASGSDPRPALPTVSRPAWPWAGVARDGDMLRGRCEGCHWRSGSTPLVKWLPSFWLHHGRFASGLVPVFFAVAESARASIAVSCTKIFSIVWTVTGLDGVRS